MISQQVDPSIAEPIVDLDPVIDLDEKIKLLDRLSDRRTALGDHDTADVLTNIMVDLMDLMLKTPAATKEGARTKIRR